MRYVLSFAILVSSSLYGAEVDCSRHKIFCAIKEINPKVNKELAMELSNYLYKYSTLYKTNPLRSVAIVAQESMFRNVNTEEDFGIFQFNIHTAEAYGIDLARAEEDLQYATLEHVRLLARKKEYCKDLDSEAWTCYHSRTERHRLKYKELVDRYYVMIEKGE